VAVVTADKKNVIDSVNKFSDQLKLAVILFYQGARKPCSGSETTNGRTKTEGRRGMVHVLYRGKKCF